MFEELDALDKLREVFEDILSHNLDEAIGQSVDAIATAAMHQVLIQQATKAVSIVKEYSYPALRDHFLDHIKAHPEYVQIVDGVLASPLNNVFEENAGNYEDFISGVESAGGHTGTPAAPFIWRFGIYMPAREGGSGRTKGRVAKIVDKYDIPNYAQVISERISAWGEKIPYWFFIAYGNAGYDRAYPSFGGYNFIVATENSVARIVNSAKEIYGNGVGGLLNSLGIEVQEFIKIPAKGTRVTIQKLSIGRLNISRQLTSKGNIFWNVGGHMLSPEAMINLIKG